MINFDAAAALPVSDAVSRVWQELQVQQLGNPDSIHGLGQVAKETLESARKNVASILEVKAEQVYFTSGATEGLNIALQGRVKTNQAKGKRSVVITSSIEHPAVTAQFESLAADIVRLPINEEGFSHLSETTKEVLALEANADVSYIFVHTLVQGEVGTVQPVRALQQELTAVVGELFTIVDASQAPLWLPLRNVTESSDVIVFDGLKIGSGAGNGVLILKNRNSVLPLVFGGGQERGMRPGTSNVLGAAMFAMAFKEAQAGLVDRVGRVAEVRDKLWEELKAICSEAEVNGFYKEGDVQKRVANNLHVFIPGYDAEELTVRLDQAGMAVAYTTSCHSSAGRGSQAIEAMYGTGKRQFESLRLTLLPTVTTADIEPALSVFTKVIR